MIRSIFPPGLVREGDKLNGDAFEFLTWALIVNRGGWSCAIPDPDRGADVLARDWVKGETKANVRINTHVAAQALSSFLRLILEDSSEISLCNFMDLPFNFTVSSFTSFHSNAADILILDLGAKITTSLILS